MKKKPALQWVNPFLNHLAENGNVAAACRWAGISRQAAYQHYRKSKAFRRQWDEAERCATKTVLEPEAWRRAVEGVDEPIIAFGQIMGHWEDEEGNIVPEGTEGARKVPTTVKQYSDRLLETLLKARDPERYADRAKHEHTGPGGKPIQTNSTQVQIYIPDNGRGD